MKTELLSKFQNTKWIGKELIYLDSVDSTNNKIKELAKLGYVNGTIVVADKQTAGRGRRGRVWESPEGTSIYMSALLRPQIEPSHASMLTLVAALAVSEAITKLTDAQVKIKWPNDIVMNGKKICGILTEMSVLPDGDFYIVVGIGINAYAEDFPEEIRNVATSIFLQTGKKVNRADLVECVWEKFEEYYEIFQKTENLEQLMDGYNKKLANIDQQVKVLDPADEFEGIAKGITEKGELIVDTKEERKLISSGEVSVRGIYGYV